MSEPITSEPIIVSSTDIDNNETSQNNEPSLSLTLEDRMEKLEKLLAAQSLDKEDKRATSCSRSRARSRSYSRSPVVIRRRRYISPSPAPKSPIINNTFSLLTVLNELSTKTDVTAEIQSATGGYGVHIAYLTTLSRHQAELDKFSWILKMGLEDRWVLRPETHVGRDAWNYEFPGASPGGRRNRDYDNDFNDQRFDRGSTPVVKIGNLFTAVFTDKNSTDSGVEKVKFITVVQGKPQVGWSKILVSHSKAATLTDIFHEMINGYSIVFVGAVLREAVLPIASLGSGIAAPRGVDVELRKVASVKEAEELEKGIVGVIC